MSVIYRATVNDVEVGAQSLKGLERAVKQEEARQATEAAAKEEKQQRANELAWAHYGMIADRAFGCGATPWFITPKLKPIDDYTKGVLVEHSRYGNGDLKIGTEYECVSAIMTAAGDTLAVRVQDPHTIAGPDTYWHAVGSFDGACQGHMLSQTIADKLESRYQEYLATKHAA